MSIPSPDYHAATRRMEVAVRNAIFLATTTGVDVQNLSMLALRQREMYLQAFRLAILAYLRAKVRYDAGEQVC